MAFAVSTIEYTIALEMCIRDRPYGVVYSARAGEDVLEFVKILQHEAEKIK